jgi:hypothetical protein
MIIKNLYRDADLLQLIHICDSDIRHKCSNSTVPVPVPYLDPNLKQQHGTLRLLYLFSVVDLDKDPGPYSD